MSGKPAGIYDGGAGEVHSRSVTVHPAGPPSPRTPHQGRVPGSSEANIQTSPAESFMITDSESSLKWQKQSFRVLFQESKGGKKRLIKMLGG